MLHSIDFKELSNMELVPQAIISKPIASFDRRPKIVLVDGEDDFDVFRGAALSLNGDLLFALKHYRGYPDDTTTIYLPRGVTDVKEITRIVKRIVQELELPTSVIRWQRADDPNL
jgi:hypothetical protein